MISPFAPINLPTLNKEEIYTGKEVPESEIEGNQISGSENYV